MSAARTPRTRPLETAEDDGYVLPEPVLLSPEEAWEAYDSAARLLLGMTADEFEAELAAGRFGSLEPEDRAAVRVMMFRVPRPAGDGS